MTVTKAYCNWLQGVEATLDTAHVGTLHSGYLGHGAAPTSVQLAPRYEVEHTPYGLDAAALRPLPDGTTHLRSTKWVFPFVSLVPGGPQGTIFIAAPIDDHHHNLFFGGWALSDDVPFPKTRTASPKGCGS